jgi:Transposase DDE domain
VTNCYDLMDAAYDAQGIRDYSASLDHVPLIDFNHRSPKDPREFLPHEAERYKERSSAERVNSQLKDNYGARVIRVRGGKKVFAELMFGLLVIAVEQTLRLLS